MFKKMVAVAISLMLAMSFAGCKKKEQKPQLPPGHPPMEGMQGTMPEGMPLPEMQKVDRKVIVPKEVAAKWKSVKLSIEDKSAKKSKEYVVAVGSSVTVPNSKLTVKVLAFVPDFRMGDHDITSASNKPNNPAAQLSVTEPGKPEWKGWVYSEHPGVHPYQHDKFGIILIGGISK